MKKVTMILSETKLKRKTRQKKMKLCIFATSNQSEKLSSPLRSKFMELHLDEYTYEEFTEIDKRLAKKRHKLDELIPEKIAYAVWNRMHSRDIRDAMNIAKLTTTSTDVDWLVDVQLKYGRKTAISIKN